MRQDFALAGVTQWVGCWPAKQKVTASNTGQGACLGCGFGPWSGHIREVTKGCFSHTLMFLSLSFSLPSLLSKNK